MATGRYVTAIEAAKILGAHGYTVRNLLNLGQLKGALVGSTWLIEGADVEEFAKVYVPKVGQPVRIESRRSSALPDPVLTQMETQSDWDNKVGS